MLEPSSPWLPAPSPAPPEPTAAASAAARASAIHGARQAGSARFTARAKRRLGAIGATLLAVLSKLKLLLLLLPKVKLLATAGTMVVSILAYSTIWGIPFAAGFVVLLLVHEMGHVIALRREGIKASAPMFIPFLGAVISARSLGDNALAEARVGLAGPILGSLGSAACILVWHATGSDLWRALAFTGFFLNLFNLIPVTPLDGGRAMAAMAPWLWFVGFAGLIALEVVIQSPILLLIMLVAAFDLKRRWEHRRNDSAQPASYYKTRPLDRILVGAVYLSLIALLVVGMHATTLNATL